MVLLQPWESPENNEQDLTEKIILLLDCCCWFSRQIWLINCLNPRPLMTYSHQIILHAYLLLSYPYLLFTFAPLSSFCFAYILLVKTHLPFFFFFLLLTFFHLPTCLYWCPIYVVDHWEWSLHGWIMSIEMRNRVWASSLQIKHF